LEIAAFFDVDGTLTDTRVWEGIMQYFKVRGQRQWTNRLFWAYHMPIYFTKKAGLISEGGFRKPWSAHLAWFVRGYSLEQAQPVWDWVVKEFMINHWREDIRQLLEGHRQAGDHVILVSGGPAPLLECIAAEVGAAAVVGTRFEIREDKYTGRSLEPVCLDENKVILAKRYLQENHLEVDYQASTAYADSISDLKLLEMVGKPAAVYPDDRLRQVAGQRGWLVFPEKA